MIRESVEILSQGKADEAMLHHLEDAVTQHPYSAAMHVLLARSAHLTENPKFEEYVRDAAIRTQNRKQLHAFVFTTLETEVEEETPTTTDLNEEVTEPTSLLLPALTDSVESEALEIEPQPESDLEPESTEATAEVDKNVPEAQNTEEEKEESVLEKSDLDSARIEVLERQFLSEVLAAGAAIDLLSDDSIEQDHTNYAQNIREQRKESDNTTFDDSEIVEESEEETTEVTEPKTETTPEKLSLSGWLHFLEDETLETESSTQESVKAKTPNYVSTETKSETIKGAKEVSEIISTFIQNESQIVPKRAEFFSPAKAAKNSLMDKEDLVTETLANVYAAQGNISKAISTYEKLSLLHPEKSAYFAALIKKLKRQL